jgi:hypothetical protein
MECIYSLFAAAYKLYVDGCCNPIFDVNAIIDDTTGDVLEDPGASFPEHNACHRQ